MKTNINTVKAILSFIWLLPFVYKLIDLYTNHLTFWPTLIFNGLLVLSLVASMCLLVIWIKEFLELRYLKKAFEFLKLEDIEQLDNIYNKVPTYIYTNYKTTLLQFAIDKQLNEDVVAYLLSKGEVCQITDNNEYNLSVTLFNLAAYYNYFNIEMLNYLLSNGAYINYADDSKGFEGLSILHCLILRGNVSAINLAIKYGADLNYFITDQSLNALMLACKYIEDPIVIKALLESGADVNEVNKDGFNALLIAAKYNVNPSVITLLVNYGAKIMAYQVKEAIFKTNVVTPLYLASIQNVGLVVDKLIELGDNVNFKDNFGMSVLFMACAHNTDVDVIKNLLNNGLSLDNYQDTEGNTPLMVAAYLNSNSNVIRYILNKSHNLGSVNKDGLSFIDYLQQNANLSKEEKEIIVNKWI